MILEFISQFFPVTPSSCTTGYVIQVSKVPDRDIDGVKQQKHTRINLGEGQVSFLVLLLHECVSPNHFTMILLSLAKNVYVCVSWTEGRQTTWKKILLSWYGLFSTTNFENMTYSQTNI